MHVKNGLLGVRAGVEDEPVPAELDALGDRDLAGRADELVKQPGTRGGEGRHVGKMIPRHHQDVRWRLGADVAEGDGTFAFQHYRGRDLSGHDPAEQAVWHITIIVAARCARCRTAPAGPRPTPALAPCQFGRQTGRGDRNVRAGRHKRMAPSIVRNSSSQDRITH